MIIGFTGTRYGLSQNQEFQLGMTVLGMDLSEFHHGDCKGADEEALAIVRDLKPKARVVVHPPLEKRWRAFTRYYHECREPLTYLDRNRAIVADCQLLIATPRESTWQNKGGTWFTISEAQRQNKKVYLIWPDGSLEEF